MVFFDGGNLALGDGLLQDVVENVGLRQRRVVVHVRAEEAVLVGNLLIDSNGEIILADYLLPCKNVLCNVSANGSIRCVEKRQILLATLSSTSTGARCWVSWSFVGLATARPEAWELWIRASWQTQESPAVHSAEGTPLLVVVPSD